MDHEIPLRGSSFPPIADYALLSDCEVCALVAPSGNVEWLSLPQMDGPSVFAAILDRQAGRFRAGPLDRMVPAGRRYLPGTMILETTWGTPTGWLEVRDVLLIGFQKLLGWHAEPTVEGAPRRGADLADAWADLTPDDGRAAQRPPEQ